MHSMPRLIALNVLVTLGLAGFSQFANALECLEVVGELPGGWPHPVELIDHTAYLGVGGWFQVVDVSDSTTPIIMSSTRVQANDIEISGDLAFVANYNGLAVIDIQDPETPHEVGTLDHPDGGRAVSLVNDIAVVMSYKSLWIADVSDPESPIQIGFLDIPFDYLVDLAVIGNQAFVSAHRDHLWLIDISDPTAPTLVSTHLTTDEVEGLTAVGHLLFAAVWDHGLRILDADPSSEPFEIGWLDTVGHAQRVEVEGGLAFLSETDNGLRIIDIGNPSLPVEVSLIDPQYQIDKVTVDGATAMVSAGPELRIIDVSEPSAPLESGSLHQRARAGDIFVSDGIAYTLPALGYSVHAGMELIDISQPTEPNPLSFVPLGWAQSVVATGDHAYVLKDGDVTTEIHVFDVSDPTDPVLLVELFPFPGWCEDPQKLDFVGGHLAVGCLYSGLHFFDISTPSTIHEVGFISFGQSYLLDFAVEDDLVVACTSGDSIRMVDASNPNSPQEIGQYLLPLYTGARSVDVSDSLAYILTNIVPLGLHVVDISTPEQPILAGMSPVPSSGDIDVENGFAVVGGSQEVFVLDVSRPNNALEVGRYTARDDIRSVFRTADNVFLSSSDTYLDILSNSFIFTDSFETETTSAWSGTVNQTPQAYSGPGPDPPSSY